MEVTASATKELEELGVKGNYLQDLCIRYPAEASNVSFVNPSPNLDRNPNPNPAWSRLSFIVGTL